MAIYNNETDPNEEMWGNEDKHKEAVAFLESEGFYMRNLWHISDVQDKFKCTKGQALDILDRAIAEEYVMELIDERIEMFGKEDNLKPREK